MSERYLRLTQPPRLRVLHPVCDACEVDVEVDQDGLTCPSCGHWWSSSAADGDEASEPPSDLDVGGPACPTQRAWQASGLSGDARDTKVTLIRAEWTNEGRILPADTPGEVTP